MKFLFYFTGISRIYYRVLQYCSYLCSTTFFRRKKMVNHEKFFKRKIWGFFVGNGGVTNVRTFFSSFFSFFFCCLFSCSHTYTHIHTNTHLCFFLIFFLSMFVAACKRCNEQRRHTVFVFTLYVHEYTATYIYLFFFFFIIIVVFSVILAWIVRVRTFVLQ